MNTTKLTMCLYTHLTLNKRFLILSLPLHVFVFVEFAQVYVCMCECVYILMSDFFKFYFYYFFNSCTSLTAGLHAYFLYCFSFGMRVEQVFFLAFMTITNCRYVRLAGHAIKDRLIGWTTYDMESMVRINITYIYQLRKSIKVLQKALCFNYY